MPFRLEVVPELLSSAALRQQREGERLAAIAAGLEATAADAADAAGDPALTAALVEHGAAGAASVRSLGVSVGALGARLGSAGAAYEETDRSAMPGG